MRGLLASALVVTCRLTMSVIYGPLRASARTRQAQAQARAHGEHGVCARACSSPRARGQHMHADADAHKVHTHRAGTRAPTVSTHLRTRAHTVSIRTCRRPARVHVQHLQAGSGAGRTRKLREQVDSGAGRTRKLFLFDWLETGLKELFNRCLVLPGCPLLSSPVLLPLPEKEGEAPEFDLLPAAFLCCRANHELAWDITLRRWASRSDVLFLRAACEGRS